MVILASIPILETFDIPIDDMKDWVSVFSDSVFTNPSSLISYIHEIIITIGNPSIASTTRKLMVHSGIFREGMRLPAAC